MRILFATFWTFPHTGGITTYMKALKSGLESMGHHVDVLAHGPQRRYLRLSDGSFHLNKDAVTAAVRHSVEAYCRRHAPRATPFVRDREAARYSLELAASRLDLGRYDVIHTQDVIATCALARVRPRHVPVVATIHSPLVREVQLGTRLGRSARRYIALEERIGLLSAQQIIVPSDWLKGILVTDYRLSPYAFTVIHSGVDLAHYRQLAAQPPQQLPQPDGHPVIVCPARLTQVKGHDYLLRALSILARRRRRFVCWLAGGGPGRQRLEEQAWRLRLGGRVVFLGARSDVPALLRRADMVVLPSLMEGGLPYAVQEAQLAGKPVVASRVGSVVDMVEEGVTGLLVPPRSPAALSSAIDRLLSSEDLRLTLGANARIRAADRWNAERMTRETLAVYEQVLGLKHTFAEGETVGAQDFVPSAERDFDQSAVLQGDISWSSRAAAGLPDP
ncbi:MAG: glycosyltransferase family 4 protein [Bacillota bacterium]